MRFAAMLAGQPVPIYRDVAIGGIALVTSGYMATFFKT